MKKKEIRTLIVEDDPMMSFLQKVLVEKHEISTSPRCFLNGKEALDHMVSASGDATAYLVLLDLNMPVMNGWEFLDRLRDREVARRTVVVIVTSSIDPRDKEKAAEYKMVKSYLSKPLKDFSEIKQLKKQLENKDC